MYGTVDKVERLLKKCDLLSKEAGLLLASGGGNISVTEYLIKKGAVNLDEALAEACKKNRYSIADLLVRKGASTTVGLRYATSLNIIRMLYRCENGGGNII